MDLRLQNRTQFVPSECACACVRHTSMKKNVITLKSFHFYTLTNEENTHKERKRDTHKSMRRAMKMNQFTWRNDGIKFSATLSSDKQQIDREKKKKKKRRIVKRSIYRDEKYDLLEYLRIQTHRESNIIIIIIRCVY